MHRSKICKSLNLLQSKLSTSKSLGNRRKRNKKQFRRSVFSIKQSKWQQLSNQTNFKQYFRWRNSKINFLKKKKKGFGSSSIIERKHLRTRNVATLKNQAHKFNISMRKLGKTRTMRSLTFIMS